MNKRLRVILNILTVAAAIVFAVTIIMLIDSIRYAGREVEDPAETYAGVFEYELSHRAYGEIMGQYYVRRMKSMTAPAGYEDLYRVAEYAHAAFMTKVCDEKGDTAKANRYREKAAALRNELGAYEYTADEVDKKIGKAENKTDGKSESERRSLAGRMAGKYSYHAGGENGENEYYTMDVVNFGDNLYAFCGRAFPDGDDSFGTYSFWATEFVPYDAKEISSADGDSVKVNELNFSVMSNAGKYWDSGHTGTITLTDDGLVFAGFDHDGFLVPDNDDSRLFLKDDRAEDAFKYLKHRKRGGDEDIQGFWVARDGDSDLYIEFSVTNMYIYSKDPDSEVFFAAGGCDFREGGFDFAGNFIENGGMPFEFAADYKIEGDSLKLAIKGDDVPDRMLREATFERISEEDIHVTTMDEIVFDEDSFGAFGQMENEPFYGV